MLSRVENVRVFESSEDVIYYPSSRRYSQLNSAAQRSRCVDQEIEAEEDEQLHPQHPYRMRKRALQRDEERSSYVGQKDVRSIDQELVAFNRQDRRPMELVFLSSGEIRAREDCPPGLGLPKLQQDRSFRAMNAKPRLKYHTDEEDDEFEEDKERDKRQKRYEKSVDRRKTRTQMRTPKEQRQQVDRRRHERLDSSSSPSERSVSKDVDISLDDVNESVVAKRYLESKRQEKKRLALNVQGRRQGAQKTDKQVEAQERSVAIAAKTGVKDPPTWSLPLDRQEGEEDGDAIGRTIEQSHSARQTAALRVEKETLSGATCHETKQHPAPIEKEVECVNDGSARRTKRSPKMKVSHLVSDESASIPKSKNLSNTRREDHLIDRLEAELRKEKLRVLEKATHLLDEQDKNQQLCDRAEALEAQLAAKDSETNSKICAAARTQEEQSRSFEKEQDARVKKLEEQVRLQEADIGRLNRDKMELKAAIKQLKTTESHLSDDQRGDTKDMTGLQAELDDMTCRFHDFLAKVKLWKSKSKDEMETCDDKSDLPVLLESVWLNFPQFPGVYPRPHTGNSSPRQQQSENDEQTEAFLYLKKRLRQREDELRRINIKYVELKEMCARQCVREADLQNFINEHRLRGNLIIRKNSSSKPRGTGNNQEVVQEDQHYEQRRSATLKMIPNVDTNTRNEKGGDEEDFAYEEYSDNQDSNADCEDGDGFEDPVQTPEEFVEVGRDGVYEDASPTNLAATQKVATDRNRGKRKMQTKQQLREAQRVEHARHVASPSPAQRYERVLTSTMTAARRKKSVQQSFHQIGECPPGCGSRPSFMRKKAPAIAARAKRSVVTTASKGSIGVIRPWM